MLTTMVLPSLAESYAAAHEADRALTHTRRDRTPPHHRLHRSGTTPVLEGRVPRTNARPEHFFPQPAGTAQESITRKEAVSELVTILFSEVKPNYRLNPNYEFASFKDVHPETQYFPITDYANRIGLVLGHTGGEFRAHNNITREELAAMTVRLLELMRRQGIEIRHIMDSGESENLTDFGRVSNFAVTAMPILIENGILLPDGNNMIHPQKEVTSGDMMRLAMFFESSPRFVNQQRVRTDISI